MLVLAGGDGIAGDPAAVEDAAATMRKAAADLTTVAEDIGSHGREVTSAWVGNAADAAGDHIAQLSNRAHTGADALAKVPEVLMTYAAELRAAQAAWEAASAAADPAPSPAQAAGMGAASAMADAVARAQRAGEVAAAAIDRITDELAGMNPTATATAVVSARSAHRHGDTYNEWMGLGDGSWAIGPGTVGWIFDHLPGTVDHAVGAHIEGAHVWLQDWADADRDSDAYRLGDGGVQMASIVIPGADVLTAGRAVEGGADVVKGAKAAEGLAGEGRSARSIPDWIRRLWKGQQWHTEQQARLVAQDAGNIPELAVVKNTASGRVPAHNRVDLYNPDERAITSMKHTQLAAIKPKTAEKYIDELATKYPPGSKIADTPRNRQLGVAGDRLEGEMRLLVPKQSAAIPPDIVAYAASKDVQIIQAP